MTDHKFTDEEIVKMIESCARGTKEGCNGCPAKQKGALTGDICIFEMTEAAFDFVNRQMAEIDALKIANEKMYAAAKEQEAEIDRLEGALRAEERHNEETMALAQKALANAKSTVICEFALRFKERMQDLARLQNGDATLFLVGEQFIDQVVKEMTEEAP